MHLRSMFENGKHIDVAFETKIQAIWRIHEKDDVGCIFFIHPFGNVQKVYLEQHNIPNITIAAKWISSYLQVGQIDTFRFKWSLCCIWIVLSGQCFVIVAHINWNILHSTQLMKCFFRNIRNRCIVQTEVKWFRLDALQILEYILMMLRFNFMEN